MKQSNNFKDIIFDAKQRPTVLTYEKILNETRQYIIDNQADLLSKKVETQADKDLIKITIEFFVSQEKYSLPDKTTFDIINDLYNDMVRYSFLEKWIYKDGIEEVNINSWNDIEIIESGKKPRKINEQFTSPQHAIDVVKRMLASHDIILDDTKPAVTGYLDAGIRICCFKSPIVSDETGVSASIRIVKPNTVSKKSLLQFGTAREDELDLLSMFINYRVSVCASGDTGSGKTTTLSWLLSTIPDGPRVLTMEEGSREFILSRLDPNTGRPKNSVVSLLTRESDNPALNVTLQDLNEYAMRMDPRIIAVGEMRSAEAYEVSEVARTGHTVVSTIHSMSAESTYRKMMTLAYKKYQMDTDLMLSLMVEAFPIIFYQEQQEDGSRKIMEVIEGESTDGNNINYRTLYKFIVLENHKDKNGNIVKIDGMHVKMNNISEKMQKFLISKGLPREELQRYLDIPLYKPESNLKGA